MNKLNIDHKFNPGTYQHLLKMLGITYSLFVFYSSNANAKETDLVDLSASINTSDQETSIRPMYCGSGQTPPYKRPHHRDKFASNHCEVGELFCYEWNTNNCKDFTCLSKKQKRPKGMKCFKFKLYIKPIKDVFTSEIIQNILPTNRSPSSIGPCRSEDKYCECQTNREYITNVHNIFKLETQKYCGFYLKGTKNLLAPEKISYHLKLSLDGNPIALKELKENWKKYQKDFKKNDYKIRDSLEVPNFQAYSSLMDSVPTFIALLKDKARQKNLNSETKKEIRKYIKEFKKLYSTLKQPKGAFRSDYQKTKKGREIAKSLFISLSDLIYQYLKAFYYYTKAFNEEILLEGHTPNLDSDKLFKWYRYKKCQDLSKKYSKIVSEYTNQCYDQAPKESINNNERDLDS